MKFGVLALQGDFREHIAMVASLGIEPVAVRTPGELVDIDALVLPGGESTTIGRLADRYGLLGPIRERCVTGMPALGTCAGMIFLASATTGAHQHQLGVLDAVVERNAFGRQVDSFEAELDVVGLSEPMHAVFIRAPWIAKLGADVETLAAITDRDGDEHPVLVRQGNILAASFHPELTGDTRLHAMLAGFVRS